MAARRRYGWVRDRRDRRDHAFASPYHPHELPDSADLTAAMPPVYDQLDTSSCTGNGVAALLAWAAGHAGLPDGARHPSRLFAYWNGRAAEGATAEDDGAYPRDVIKGVARLGCCPEVWVAGVEPGAVWPFDPARVTARPADACFAAAKTERALRYQRVPQDVLHLRACLAAGRPFGFGIEVAASLESAEVARTGVVPLPQRGEKRLGGHYVVAVGYDAPARKFLVRNSWGVAWGIGGHCLLDDEYLLDPGLSSDFWTILSVGP